MKKHTHLLLIALVCFVLAGCTLPGVTIVVEPRETPVQGETPSSLESPVPLPPTPTLGAPTPTNTLVIPPTAGETPLAEPASPSPAGEPSQPGEPEPATSPIPTTEVASELVELGEYGQNLQEELIEPLEEMATTLEELGIGSGEADVVAICAGVEVVVATLAEVQQGLEEVGAPPTEDTDLQECWVELNAAVDDLEQGTLILGDICETFRVGQLPQVVAYLESGAQHMENAAAAFERWEAKMGF